MGLVSFLGRLSDQLTRKLLAMHNGSQSIELVRHRTGFVRKSQLSAIIATSVIMMLANILNAIALITLQWQESGLSGRDLAWAAIVFGFAGLGISNARQFGKSRDRPTASVKAPGKILISSTILALIWCYPPLFLVPNGSMLQIAFVTALTAGMVAGGALALYPVPLAAFVYVSILTLVSFWVVLGSTTLPVLPFAFVMVAFTLVVTFSVRRHTGMFLAELVGKLEAEQQRDMVNLLLDSYQHSGGQFLWRSDPMLNLMVDRSNLLDLLSLDASQDQTHNLLEIFRAADATGHEVEDTTVLLSLCQSQDQLPESFECTIRCRNGLILKFVGREDAQSGAATPGYHGYVKDITKDIHAAEKIFRLATRDTMTGLLNYTAFIRQANARISMLRDTGSKVYFLFIDADNLKSVNDSFGHAAGDSLIETLAARLNNCLPPGSIVARKGGDEFVALIAGDHLAHPRDIALDTVYGVSNSFCFGQMEIPLSCCVGLSEANTAEAALSKLELEADRALYFAKSQGKGRAQVYEAAIGRLLRRDREIALGLEGAIENKDLRLVFQPILDIRTDHILGAEALLRWRHPIYGDIPPEKIVAIAQSEGLGTSLLHYVLREAISCAILWPEECFLSVNIHPDELKRIDFASGIMTIANDAQLPLERLWLEVTESETLKDIKSVHYALGELRAAGVKIAIDDFGTGYSAFSYLTEYPIDIVKLDKSLVHRCNENVSNRTIIGAISTLAKMNNFKIVAEGVETPQEITALREDQITFVQGFALFKPLTANDAQSIMCGAKDADVSVINKLGATG